MIAYFTLGLEFNKLSSQVHSSDRAESDSNEVIDVSYFYCLFSPLCQLWLVELLGSRSSTNILCYFRAHFESGGGYNRPFNWRYRLKMVSIFFSFDAEPLHVDDVGALSPHSFKSSSFSIPTQCSYCKVFPSIPKKMGP